MTIWIFLGPVLLVLLIWFVIRTVRRAEALAQDNVRKKYLMMNIFTILAICFSTIGLTLIADIISLAIDYGFYAYSLSLYLFIGFTIPGIASSIIAVILLQQYKIELTIHQELKSEITFESSLSSN